jgi:hypothetical protein
VAGELVVYTMVRDGGTVTGYINNTATSTADTTTGSPSNTDALRVGRLSGAGTGYAAMEWFAGGVCRRALTADEIGEIVAHYT